MKFHTDLSNISLRNQIKRGVICFGGNANLKIYGKLNCGSGKGMKKQNRVFFASEIEARQLGFRPCGHCLKKQYYEWKSICLVI